MRKSLRMHRGPSGLARLAALAGTAGLVAAAGANVATAAAANATAAGAAAASAAAARPAATTAVPWNSVTTGWTLALYTKGAIGSAATTLYLVSPSGRTYAVHQWPHGTSWSLVAMSPTGTEALFADSNPMTGKTRADLLNLKTGAVSGFGLPSLSLVIGYGPAGDSVLVGTRSAIYRYSRAGVRLASVTHAAAGNGIDYSVVPQAIVRPGTRDIVLGDKDGLLLVTPSGALVRYLAVPGTNGTCTPARFKNHRVILAYCTPRQASSGPRVFAVPVTGQRPTAVTRVRDFTSADYGDTDAWVLSGKTFVQAETGCGPEFLGLQHKNGSVTPVSMPGKASGSVVDASTGFQLMITRASCEGFNILMRFNPLTHASKMIFNGTTGGGAYDVVADNQNGTQP